MKKSVKKLGKSSMKKSSMKGGTKMKKAMSPQDKFKAMIEAKKKGKKGGTKKMSSTVAKKKKMKVKAKKK